MTRILSRYYNLVILIVVLIISLTGCSVNRLSATVEPGSYLRVAKEFFVVKLKSDSRQVDDLIRDKLVSMGYRAMSGSINSIPNTTDIIVMYRDKWDWDISTYMLQLNIRMIDPKTNIPVATGFATHTSFSRKSPEEMVDEVLRKIFAKAT